MSGGAWSLNDKSVMVIREVYRQVNHSMMDKASECLVINESMISE